MGYGLTGHWSLLVILLPALSFFEPYSLSATHSFHIYAVNFIYENYKVFREQWFVTTFALTIILW
jgi:hypothetical protein